MLRSLRKSCKVYYLEYWNQDYARNIATGIPKVDSGFRFQGRKLVKYIRCLAYFQMRNT